MQTKFTAGPWVAKGRYIGTKNHMSSIGECRDVNGNWSDDAKSHANACLIAAAPEMYTALSYALAALKELNILEATQELIIDAQRKALGV